MVKSKDSNCCFHSTFSYFIFLHPFHQHILPSLTPSPLSYPPATPTPTSTVERLTSSITNIKLYIPLHSIPSRPWQARWHQLTFVLSWIAIPSFKVLMSAIIQDHYCYGWHSSVPKTRPMLVSEMIIVMQINSLNTATEILQSHKYS